MYVCLYICTYVCMYVCMYVSIVYLFVMQESFMECVYLFDDDGSQVSNTVEHTHYGISEII